MSAGFSGMQGERSVDTPRSMAAAVGILIGATALVQLANGFFTTFVSLRIVSEGFEPALAGVVLSSYFAGFTFGAVRSEPIIARIGHIRAYAAFAGTVAIATAAMPLKVDPVAWIVFRAVIGFGCAGLFVTTESWLNAKAPPALRGRVFAVYMVGTFLALAVGQLLIGQIDVDSAAPFNVIVALFALGLVLVSATWAEPPEVVTVAAPPYRELFRTAPVATIGCALSGIITGTFYALVPAWMQGSGMANETIAMFMFAAVIGGLAFQIPVGRLSDAFDRRGVIAGLGVGLAVVAVAIVFLPRSLVVVLPAAAMLGGFMSTLYPVCIAFAHDRMPADRVVSLSGALILISGIGSVLGPLVGTPLMATFDIDGVLYLMAAAAMLLVFLAMAGRLSTASPPHQERTFAILTPQAAPVAHDPADAEHDAADPAKGTATAG